MTIHQPNRDVRESFVQAQQQAAAMAGPATPWDAPIPGVRRRPPRWIGVATMSMLAGGVVGWMGAGWWSGSSPSVPASAPEQASPGSLHGPVSFATPLPEAALKANVAPPVAAQSTLSVTRQSGLIRIASTNASLPDVVHELARATNTSVRGADALGAITSPITLNWQGNNTAAAWEALLGRFANIGVSCGSAFCELWIVGVNTPRVSANAPSIAGSTAATEAATPSLPTARQTPPPPPSNGDENTETN